FFFLSFFFPHLPSSFPYTLSLHDALPIFQSHSVFSYRPSCLSLALLQLPWPTLSLYRRNSALWHPSFNRCQQPKARPPAMPPTRSEEHTSELQSRFDLVCRLLLEKKNTNK